LARLEEEELLIEMELQHLFLALIVDVREFELHSFLLARGLLDLHGSLRSNELEERCR
jgi:hypothetical protein